MSIATEHTPAGAGAPGGFLGRSRTFSGVSPAQIGVAWLWLSVIVLLPLAAITVQSFDNGWSGFWDAITDDAQRASAVICERCGVPGVLQRTRYWAKTLCHSCADPLGYAPAPPPDLV